MIKTTKKAKDGMVKVTFQLPADAARQSVAIVGDFNGWDAQKDPMKLNKKNRTWSKTLQLEAGREYQFRYFIDGSQWQNEEQATRQVPNPYGTTNAVITA